MANVVSNGVKESLEKLHPHCKGPQCPDKGDFSDSSLYSVVVLLVKSSENQGTCKMIPSEFPFPGCSLVLEGNSIGEGEKHLQISTTSSSGFSNIDLVVVLQTPVNKALD